MTKVANKNDNITFFGGFYHIIDVFSKLGLEKLTNHLFIPADKFDAKYS